MTKEPSQKDLDLYNGVKENYIKIKDSSIEELAAIVKVLGYKHPDAFELLHFIDAYQELRRRRNQ